jgi:hypothetical protein
VKKGQCDGAGPNPRFRAVALRSYRAEVDQPAANLLRPPMGGMGEEGKTLARFAGFFADGFLVEWGTLLASVWVLATRIVSHPWELYWCRNGCHNQCSDPEMMEVHKTA